MNVKMMFWEDGIIHINRKLIPFIGYIEKDGMNFYIQIDRKKVKIDELNRYGQLLSASYDSCDEMFFKYDWGLSCDLVERESFLEYLSKKILKEKCKNKTNMKKILKKFRKEKKNDKSSNKNI